MARDHRLEDQLQYITKELSHFGIGCVSCWVLERRLLSPLARFQQSISSVETHTSTDVFELIHHPYLRQGSRRTELMRDITCNHRDARLASCKRIQPTILD
jgi:hypothetical protein